MAYSSISKITVMNDKKIGGQIKKARIEAHLTQGQLGKKIGVTWEMISRYENGKSSPRKNLEEIAKVLKRPIQYFFGVEEAPIGDEIKKLYELLQKRGAELGGSGKVPFIEYLEEFSLSKSLSLTKQNYLCPIWIYSQFKDLFALKLTNVNSDVVAIGADDIGFFSRGIKPEVNNYVLRYKDKRYIIEHYSGSPSKKIHGVLIAIEKKYFDRKS